MKRKTFVYILLGIWLLMVISGLFIEDIVKAKLLLACAIMPFLFAVGYMTSLIPRNHRLVDMDESVKITDFTEMN